MSESRTEAVAQMTTTGRSAILSPPGPAPRYPARTAGRLSGCAGPGRPWPGRPRRWPRRWWSRPARSSGTAGCRPERRGLRSSRTRPPEPRPARHGSARASPEAPHRGAEHGSRIGTLLASRQRGSSRLATQEDALYKNNYTKILVLKMQRPRRTGRGTTQGFGAGIGLALADAGASRWGRELGDA